MSSRRKRTGNAATSGTRVQPSSKYHPERTCSDCALCGHTVMNITHFETWGTDEKQFILKHLGKELLPSSCICKSHYTEAKRHCSQNAYIPKWKKVAKPVLVCYHPHCSTTSAEDRLIVPSFETPETIKLALGGKDSSEQLVLCAKYYTEVHKHLTQPPQQSCASCGLRPKKGEQFVRHCPDILTINTVLFENTGCSQRLQSGDVICYNCYLSHTAVIKSLGEVMAPNEQLESDISTWEHELSQMGNTSQLHKAILTTVMYVAKAILPQHAILLPEASNIFLQTFLPSDTTSSKDIHLDIEEGTMKFTSQWLLSQLVIYLNRYMSYKCIHKRFGTILYRRGGDILVGLSWAMGRQRLESTEALSEPYRPHRELTNTEQVIEEAGCIINDLLHKEINKMSGEQLTDDPSSFNMASIISNTDPTLWKFLQIATRGTRERSKNNDSIEHKKKIRQFYILCLLMYCTNSNKPTQLHILLADAVEMYGGSRVLIKFLNQFGIVSSTDTHDRFVTAIADQQQQKTLWDYLPKEILTIVSADNFDLLHSNAAVYCGDQHRSYHGTTVQVVQPLPKLVVGQSTTGTIKQNPSLVVHESQAADTCACTRSSLAHSTSAHKSHVADTSLTHSLSAQAAATPVTHPLSDHESHAAATPLTHSLSAQAAATPVTHPISAQAAATPLTDSPLDHQPHTIPVTHPLSDYESHAAATPLTHSLSAQAAAIPVTHSLSDQMSQAVAIPFTHSLSVHGLHAYSFLANEPQQTASDNEAIPQEINVSPMSASPSLHGNASSPTLASPMQIERCTYSSPEKGYNNESPLVCMNAKRTASPNSSLTTNSKKKPRTVAIKSVFQHTHTKTQHTHTTSANMTTLSIRDFMESQEETEERESTLHKLFNTMISTYSINMSPNNTTTMKEFKDIFAMTSCEVEDLSPSTIYYMELMDENPDDDETMRHLAELLLENASSDNQDNYVILVGDGKTYEHLMQIKYLYGPELEKLLIFPGDWHTLANYQPVLMKAYYHAGLKELAMSSGYRGETLTSLEKCSHFKRTHNFFLQAWQAIYQQMLSAYVNKSTLSSLTDSIYKTLMKSEMSSTEIMKQVDSLLNETHQYENFQEFIQECCKQDDTWKFWSQFVFEDCLAYIGLYLAVRCHNWQLRVACLKQMAPLFSAYDRIHYQWLIPHHLADVKKFPRKILNCFEAGAFSVSLTGIKGHSIALDEAHEMCINKDMKAAVVRPTKSYLQKTSLFLRYRIAAHKHLLKQVYLPSESRNKTDETLFSKKNKTNENICAMLKTIQDFNLLPHNIKSNRGVVNVFSGVAASPAQTHDLLNFRKIGYENNVLYIKHRLLKVPSTSAPVRQQRLLTFAIKQKRKTRMTHKERESKQTIKCLRQRLAWCNRMGQGYNSTNEQYSIYPRALCDEAGNLQRGVKANWTDKLGKRYSSADPQVILNTLPTGWVPEAVIIDGIFLIQCAPLRQTSTISQYADLLFNRFISHHFKSGAVEVHLIFDSPTMQSFNPKNCERNRRDSAHTSTSSHEHIIFTPSTKIPNSWRTLIECRECKQSIMAALSLAYVQTTNLKLGAHQKLIIAGVLQDAWEISGGDTPPQTRELYTTNAEEADMRIWRHAYQTRANKILIYSPDTDVYNIGLPLTYITSHVECIVQLNLPHSNEQRFVSLNNLKMALENDPDLASIPREKLLTTFQMLFIVSGCDYTSYFAGLGKAAFLNAFYQYSNFITGNRNDGSLSDINGENGMSEGFLSFVRLVGTLYFKKHLSAFVALRCVQTPIQLFNSVAGHTTEERHKEWYGNIRGIVSDRICNEEDRMPSYTSLWRHWLRSCWVAQMWQHSPKADVYSALPPPEQSGWTKRNTGSYEIDWDSSDFQTEVQETINFLIKGCSCKKGCKTKQCSCKKNGRQCGPGCQCQGCTNLNVVSILTSKASGHQLEESSADEGSENESDSEDDEDDDTCSTCSGTGERYDTEIITDNDYLLGEASHLDT